MSPLELCTHGTFGPRYEGLFDQGVRSGPGGAFVDRFGGQWAGTWANGFLHDGRAVYTNGDEYSGAVGGARAPLGRFARPAMRCTGDSEGIEGVWMVVERMGGLVVWCVGGSVIGGGT